MELFLNIVWLVIVLTALTRLGIWAGGQSDRRRVAHVGLATVCGLALLFPIISVTDDLQSTVATVEETVTVRRVVASTALHLIPTLVAVLALVDSLIIAALAVLGFTAEKTFAVPTSPTGSVLLLRGPPSIV